MIMLRIVRFTGTPLPQIEAMYWDRALSWWPEIRETTRELSQR